MKRINSRQRIYYSIILSILFIMVLLSGSVYAEDKDPTEPVTIISPESIALDLQSGVPNTKTQITVQNVSSQMVNISFCLVLGSSKTCENEYTTTGVNGEGSIKLTIQPVDSTSNTISDEDLTIESGKIRTFIFETDLNLPEGNVFPEEWKSGYFVVETLNIQNTLNSSIPIVIKGNVLDGFSKILIEFLGKVNPNRIILFSSIISFCICVIVYLRTVEIEGYSYKRYLYSNVKNMFLLKKSRKKEEKKQKIIRTDPLLRYRMGINQWKSGESWASSFVIGVGTIAVLSEFLQPEGIITQGSWKLFSIILMIISAIPSFIFKSTTKTTNLVEEGEKTGREGYILYWLFTDGLITSLTLLAQIGVLELFFESIRSNPENTISNIIINCLEIIIILFLFYCVAFYLPHRIKEVIKSQDIKEQTKNLSSEHIYLDILKKIDLLISSHLKKKKQSQKKILHSSIKEEIQKPILHDYVPKMQQSLEYYELTKKINTADYSISEDPIVSTLYALFSDNLDILLKGCIGNNEVKQKLIYILEDINLTYKLIDQRDKPEVAKVALFRTLNFPLEMLKKVYIETKDAFIYSIDIAIAQLSSDIELDKVLDSDQQLFPNLERIIEETKEKLAYPIGNPLLNKLDQTLFLEGKKELMTAKNLEELKTRLTMMKQKIENIFDQELEPETNTLRYESKLNEEVLSNTRQVLSNLKPIITSAGKDFTDIKFGQLHKKELDTIDDILEIGESLRKLQDQAKIQRKKDIYVLANDISKNSITLQKNLEATRTNINYLASQSSEENREKRSMDIEKLINKSRMENPSLQLKPVSRL